MTIPQIIDLLKDFSLLAILVIILLIIIFLFSYKLIYKKILHGKKEIKLKSLILPFIFTGYLIILLGATFLNRNQVYFGNINLHLFSSYKEAYISGLSSNWRNIILNILLFVPMGFLIPLLNKKLRKPYITIGIGFLISLLIEIIQAIAHIGICELDDIFNNTIGTVIGYCLFYAIFIIRNKEESKKILKALLSFIPLALTIICFSTIFLIYHFQEFGNLSIESINKINMKNIIIVNKIENLSTESNTADVYKSKIYSKEEVREIAEELFTNIGSKLVDDSSILSYDQTAIFYSDNNQSIWIEYIGGTYNLNNNSSNISNNKQTNSDSSNYNPDPVRDNVTKEEILELINSIGIDLNFDYIYDINDKNTHIFKVNKFIKDDILIDGNISCSLKTSGNYNLTNNLITYNKSKACDIISEYEAYTELIKGNFAYNMNNPKIEKLDIITAELSYMLDSKAFYQPVYKFDVYINNSDTLESIYIPTIK